MDAPAKPKLERCSNACSNPGGIRRHVATPGGLEIRTGRTQTVSGGPHRTERYNGSGP